MRRFELTMMCVACKWKITDELTKHGYKNFTIDMDESVLEVNEEINPLRLIRIVTDLGYKIDEIDDGPLDFDQLTEDELMILEQELKSGE